MSILFGNVNYTRNIETKICAEEKASQQQKANSATNSGRLKELKLSGTSTKTERKD